MRQWHGLSTRVCSTFIQAANTSHDKKSSPNQHQFLPTTLCLSPSLSLPVCLCFRLPCQLFVKQIHLKFCAVRKINVRKSELRNLNMCPCLFFCCCFFQQTMCDRVYRPTTLHEWLHAVHRTEGRQLLAWLGDVIDGAAGFVGHVAEGGEDDETGQHACHQVHRADDHRVPVTTTLPHSTPVC